MAKLVVKKHCEVCKRKIHSGWFEQHLKSKGHIQKEDALKSNSRSEDIFNIKNAERAIKDFENIAEELKDTYNKGYVEGVKDTMKIVISILSRM